MFHVLAFFITCVSPGAYYAMWSGMGVMYKVLKEITTQVYASCVSHEACYMKASDINTKSGGAQGIIS
jgi:hypothetical protein